MKKELISEFKGNYIAVGVEQQHRDAPFFFYGFCLDVDDKVLILELENNTGYKQIPIEQVVDIHLDRKYNKGEQQ